MSKNKRAKLKKKLEQTMMPNLSGLKFEDAVKAFLQTPVSKDGKKAKK